MEPESHLLGRQLGDFRLLEVLGEGGMGIAYRAEQQVLGREAVIKVLSTPARSETGRQRFLREAKLASRLDHPYAAHVYAFGAETDGLLWIAMELVRGVPLDHLIEDQGAIPLARFIPFFDRLCEVVHTAHQQEIIHRDIKPANVMAVRRAGRMLPKLLDFGIARDLGREPDLLEKDESPLSPSRTRTDRAGSPGYMAPEIWIDPSKASARSDLYSLAVTAYEALTCRRLFTGTTLLEVAKSHARAEIPPLGPAFPADLDRVFKRALAKQPEQRFADVLEFATAVREAARSATAAPAIDLDEAVRDSFIAGGPQPLAEALLALGAARGEAAAWDAAWVVLDVLVRVTGVIALATRIRIGQKLDPVSAAHLRALVERGLGGDEWLDLIGALVAPFADRAMAHPIPELVAAFHAGGEARRLIRELRALRDVDADARQVQAVVTALGKVLRASTFLTDYTWAVAIDGGEAVMGPRRRPRAAAATPDGAPPGTLWLLDRDGAAVVELSPFVHVAPPSPGADDEVFVVEGPAKHGVRCVAWPREFERYDEALRGFLAEHHGTPRGRTVTGEHPDATPYRGLASFGQSDAAMFFGREREVEAVVNRLRVQPLIVVVGPSGVGKSSFVHAGVLPALPDSWQPVMLRPGPMPLSALETRLASAGVATRDLADQLRLVPDTLRRVLDDASHRQGTHVVLVVDQLEEMFTQCRDVATRDAFARALAAAAGDGSSARVILTLRDDFLVRTAELPELGARLTPSLELVTLPDPGALERILVSPLRRVGFKFESDDLPKEMIAEVREHPGALALLSFAALKLWDLRDRGFRQIPRRAYAAIGGVVGALAKHAEDTLAEMSPDHHALVRELFRHLVTSEGTRAALSRDEAIQLLGKGADAERVIEILVERRLVVAFETDEKSERIEVIHEALLSAWPRLVAWQREDAESARMRDQVRSAARQWGERGRPKGLLWRGEALLELKLWRGRQGGALTDLEHAFVAASTAEETRSRRLRRLALGAVLVGLTIGLIVLQRANRVAERNAAASRRSELAMLVEEGRTELVGGHPQEAMVYLSEAYRRGAADRNLPFMLGAARADLAGQLLVMRTDTLTAKSADETPDGTRIISSEMEGWLRVWDARTGTLERSIPTAASVVPYHVPAVLDDHRVLTFGLGIVPTVWDLTTGAQRFTLPVAEGAAAQATPDGALIVTLDGNTVRTWSALDGAARGTTTVGTAAPTGPTTLRVGSKSFVVLADRTLWLGPIDLSTPPIQLATLTFTAGISGNAVVLDPTGRWIAAIDDRRVWIWDAEHPGQSRILAGHTGLVWRTAFSPDGSKLATTSSDLSAKVWDTATGALVVTLDGHTGYVASAAWSADSTRLVTGSADHTARVWDARTGAPLAVLYGHTDTPRGVSFDRAGTHVITASNDGSVRVFDARRTQAGFDLDHAGPLTLVARGSRLLVVGADARAWLYDRTGKAVVARFGPYAETPVLPRGFAVRMQTYGDLDRDGAIALIPADTNVMVVRVDDPTHPRTLAHAARVTCARFASDGRIVTATDDGHVSIWTAAGVRERELEHGAMEIADVAFVPGTTRFAVASGDGVKLYDLAGAAAPRELPSLVSDTGLAFTADGKTLAASGDDTIVRVADVATGALQFGNQSPSTMNGIALSPDERLIFTANSEGTLGIFDRFNGRLLGLLGDARANGWITGIAATADEIISADDLGQVRFWPIQRETRPPAEVSREVSCMIPLELVANRLVPHALPARCE